MQLELLFKRRSRHESLQFCHPHPRHVFEDHVLSHHLDRGVDLRARKSQPFHDRLGHCCANAVVVVETDSARFVDSRGNRLGHIVK